MSIHRKCDGVFEVRWEGGRNKSLRVHGCYELARKIDHKKCRCAMKIGISTSSGRSILR